MTINGAHEIVSFVTEDEVQAAGETTIRCKFVLLRTSEVSVLGFGPVFRYPYHANILQAICTPRGILTRWERLPDSLKILDSDVVVQGGGHLAWNPFSRQAHFGGSSKAYGLFDPGQLQNIIAADGFFRLHTVTIED